ncbi:MAG TPA: hypothetical protein VFT62_06290 [Mycobacteriales bacterium]|nr:hypothetical protein [Mycobacteriales bacterium]
MSDVPSVEELDALSTEELRQRAFDRAEREHDAGFFWDLLRHLPGTEAVAAEDGSPGNISGGIAEGLEAVRSLFDGDVGDVEPLVRARFIDYLRRPS